MRWATPGGLGGGWLEETSRVGLGCKAGVKEADHVLYLYNSSFLLTPRGRNRIAWDRREIGVLNGGIWGWDDARK